MSLESFNTDVKNNDKNEQIHEDNEVTEESESAITVERGGSESDEHYESKSLAALQLSRLGYRVEGEKRFDDKSIRADLWAQLSTDASSEDIKNELTSLPYTIIVEVGSLNAKRAKKFNEECDVLLWLEKSSNLSDSSIVTLSDTLRVDKKFPIIDSKKIEDMLYTDSSGEKFNPSVQDIHIKKYKLLAEHILSNFNDATQFTISEIKKEVSIDNHTITKNDIEKVLNTLGFI